MTAVEQIKIKIRNILTSYIGAVVTPELKLRIKHDCEAVLKEHEEDLASAEFSLSSEWDTYTSFDKVIHYLMMDKNRAESKFTANLNIVPKIAINNNIKPETQI